MRNDRFTEGINNFRLLLPGKYAKDIDKVVFNNEYALLGIYMNVRYFCLLYSITESIGVCRLSCAVDFFIEKNQTVSNSPQPVISIVWRAHAVSLAAPSGTIPHIDVIA